MFFSNLVVAIIQVFCISGVWSITWTASIGVDTGHNKDENQKAKRTTFAEMSYKRYKTIVRKCNNGEYLTLYTSRYAKQISCLAIQDYQK